MNAPLADPSQGLLRFEPYFPRSSIVVNGWSLTLD
jgi:hypothetical protein